MARCAHIGPPPCDESALPFGKFCSFHSPNAAREWTVRRRDSVVEIGSDEVPGDDDNLRSDSHDDKGID